MDVCSRTQLSLFEDSLGDRIAQQTWISLLFRLAQSVPIQNFCKDNRHLCFGYVKTETLERVSVWLTLFPFTI